LRQAVTRSGGSGGSIRFTLRCDSEAPV
jgi:hypothetical protein